MRHSITMGLDPLEWLPGTMAQLSDMTISTNPLLVGLGPEEAAAVASRASERKFGVGEPLFAQGQPALELFVIAKGRVKVWRTSEDGAALTLTLLGRGSAIGTLGATGDVLNHATATALTPVETLAWPIRALRELMDSSSVLTSNVLRIVTNYAEQLIERLEEMASVPVEQRLARSLLRIARRACADGEMERCELPLSRQDLADLNSATLPTVSRIMSRWRSDGVIAGVRGRVILLNWQELEQIASG
jgi:CRP-like cAMP-binding protein